MKKNFVLMLFFLIFIGAIYKSLFSKASEHIFLLLNEKKIPYVLQEEKIYIYLEDVLKNGFTLDIQSSGYTIDKTTYRYVLWTDGIADDLNYNLTSSVDAQIPELPTAMKEEIYINGLQIGCYLLGEKPMIPLSEFASISDDILKKKNKQYCNQTIFFNEKGEPLALEDKILQSSKNLNLTLDGDVEDCIDFKDCSPYFIKNTLKRTKGMLSLQSVQPNEFVITKSGALVLKKIYAGELRGFRIVDLMDNYIDFTTTSERLGISFKINKGILSIERYPKNLPLHLDVSESLGTLHYYHGRLFQIVLKDTKGNLLDCLFTGDTLYINKKDLEKMSILKVSE